MRTSLRTPRSAFSKTLSSTTEPFGKTSSSSSAMPAAVPVTDDDEMSDSPSFLAMVDEFFDEAVRLLIYTAAA